MSIWPQILVAVCGTLSMISTTILIIIYIFKKSSRTYGFRLVIQLFIFDLIFSSATTIPTISGLINSDLVISSWVCRLEGATKLCSMLASFFTTVMISWTLYTHIIRGKPVKSKNPAMHFIGYTTILPLVMTVIPLSLDRIGPVDPLRNVMCFICLKEEDGNTDYTGNMLRIFVYYTPFILVLIFNIYSAIRIINYFRKNQIDYREQNDVKYLILYPIILLISWIWIIVERITESIDHANVVWLNDFDSALAVLNGFLNAFVYGFISLDPFQFFHKNKLSDTSNENYFAQNESQNSSQNNHINGCKTNHESIGYTVQSQNVSYSFKIQSNN